ncbi:hypothetical protein [Candidatus Uabimicrobium amorphum]|uniref:Uncharacterized protein n=1 Tax=Uabimicrobium amorphum TaxID=2596890 RepID=A0A5S9F1Z5_UABAM|nr:hypothetical protein [Candidatus Uabimicrobium amorphum]BBM81844.1 hypothetical protein UABAM_00184 [Candidatus Uabimicrobium amorphum]
MEDNSLHTALNVLIRVKDNLLETMVDELVAHQDDDPSSFSLQEIEDKFAIRMANLNTLIITLQDQISSGGGNQGIPRIITNVEDTTKDKLNSKLDELLEFVSPDEVLHLSVVPQSTENPDKFTIILVYQEYNG